MKRGMWGVGAWVAGGAAALAIAAFTPFAESSPREPSRRPSAASPVPRRYPAESLARVIVARDAFRMTRRPSALAYDPRRAMVSEAPPPPKPALVLVGVVGGAAATAVIEGLPGVEGSRVVRAGDEVAGIRVLEIASGRVRLAGMDTVWILRVREPWN